MALKVNQVDNHSGISKQDARQTDAGPREDEFIEEFEKELEVLFENVIESIPPEYQYPDQCRARIKYFDKVYRTPNFKKTPWKLSSDIIAQEKKVGIVEVYYIQEMPTADEGPFLKREVELINTIANRLGDFIHHQYLLQVQDDAEHDEIDSKQNRTLEWRIALGMTRRIDRAMFLNITRKLLNHLAWSDISEAKEIQQRIDSDEPTEMSILAGEIGDVEADNQQNILDLSDEVFDIAQENLPSAGLLSLIQDWMQEYRAGFLLKTLINMNSSMGEISDAIRRFVHLVPKGVELSSAAREGLRVSLIRRFLTDQLDYIKIAKDYVEIRDFHELMKCIIFPADGHGQLGGKSAGLFLARHIIKKHGAENELLRNIVYPKTWFISSDGLNSFLHYNNLEEVSEQKYKDTEQIRQEYPSIIQRFRRSQFTPEVFQGLSMALDDFGENPIIVRSSSLLEDRFGAAFSRMYRSFFLSNQGSKAERRQALMEAIAEVYASTYCADAIEYRAETGFIDYREEMGVIIQEIIGNRIGNYFLPTFTGSALSSNEFLWSSQLHQEDGLIRLVPGLSTRPMENHSGDSPILIAPGKPNLRMYAKDDEIIRKAPVNINVINLETNSLESVNIRDFLHENGPQLPGVQEIISVVQENRLKQLSMEDIDFEHDEIVVTFEGLFANTSFVETVNKILNTLKETMDTPVDIEFAYDGKNLFLLQFRPQSFATPAFRPK
ncbi:hypothetical protein HQ587_02365 [bacterium]|nr:hypothetical protein [bacterium]